MPGAAVVVALFCASAFAEDPTLGTRNSAPSTRDSITVTATRTSTRLADTPASVVVLSAETLAMAAAPAVDDALRQVPGFTLFRRSGSRTANPTSQGVSLRGVGASGASRALVLDDGIPLNDPFGGWIYWDRVPRAAIERIEVLRGGGSDLYGGSAMGGVVQLFRRSTSTRVDISGGSQQTAAGSLFAATRGGRWRGSIATDLFSTSGYVLVARGQRGAVDDAADSRHVSIDGTVERAFGDAARAFLRLSHFSESRHNGTPLQINDTSIRQIAAGVDAGPITVRAYAMDERYHQTFSSISADRSSERLTVDQRVPSRGSGGSAQWVHTIGSRSVMVAGAEERSVSGSSDEHGATHTVVSGRQETWSAFAEDTVIINSRTNVTAAMRYDGWGSETSWSPRLSLLVQATDRVAFTAAAYRAFRAPTLNELYRAFRVGNVLTLANANLRPENLSAFEAGVRGGPFRLTLFSMTTDDSIANVTLSTTPSLITRQRQNLGSSRSRGAELDGDFRASNDWHLSAGYLLADARLDTGKRTPEVPRNQATVQIAYRTRFGVQARWSAMQFDDDLNQFPLRGYFVADLFAAHPIAKLVDATLSLENVFDRRVETAATPVITLGQPRSIRIGLRWSGGL